ncbi:MAG: Na+/H+ antiporter NhaA [Usitatibacter sp.]
MKIAMERVRQGMEWLFARIVDPFDRFLRRTTAGGIVLMGTTLLALLIGWFAGGAAVEAFWLQKLGLRLGNHGEFALSLGHWVNDGLMALFFLLVGLELKREILVGELSSLRDAALPIAGAIGGMVVPALLFVAINGGTPFARGWGIPMATDIAFAVGILVLLAWRIPRNLIVFLTALAIADDLGAVLVIAIFYTSSLDTAGLLAAAALCGVLGLLNLGGVRHPLPYVLTGAALWVAVHASGVHATVAGILLAAAVPTRGEPAPLEAWEHGLTPWVTFIVVPIFALANASIDLSQVEWGAALSSPLTLGIIAGLVIGKFGGISLTSWIAVRAGLARLPAEVHWRHVLGAAWLGGIGFTMSLFVAQLAFTDASVVAQAKLGILLASAISAVAGLVWLFVAAKR